MSTLSELRHRETSTPADATRTPGPWLCVEWECDPRVNEDGNRYWGIKPDEFRSGALYLEASGWMTEANARLIAAAPELLSAALAARDAANEMLLSSADWPREQLEAAIAKAQGEA